MLLSVMPTPKSSHLVLFDFVKPLRFKFKNIGSEYLNPSHTISQGGGGEGAEIFIFRYIYKWDTFQPANQLSTSMIGLLFK